MPDTSSFFVKYISLGEGVVQLQFARNKESLDPIGGYIINITTKDFERLDCSIIQSIESVDDDPELIDFAALVLEKAQSARNAKRVLH